jgi:hypothetical protein
MKTFLSAPRTAVVAVPERLTDLCAGRCDSLPAANGTPGSEWRVRDVCPGPCSAAPGRVPSAPSLPI